MNRGRSTARLDYQRIPSTMIYLLFVKHTRGQSRTVFDSILHVVRLYSQGDCLRMLLAQTHVPWPHTHTPQLTFGAFVT